MTSDLRQIDPDIDLENRMITVPVASPTPFERFDENTGELYDEILEISESAINLSRLNGGASALINHNANKIAGQVVRAWIEGGVLCVRLQFRRHDDQALALFKDIVDGNVRNVSIGYFVEEMRFERKDGRLIGYAVRWVPYEISVAVGVPADETVGFYRSMTFKGNRKGKEKMSRNQEEVKAEIERLEAELEAERAKLRSEDEEAEETGEEKADEEDGEKKSAEDGGEEKSAEDETEEKDGEDGEDGEEKSAEDESEIRSIGAVFKRPDLVAIALKRKMSPNEFRKFIKAAGSGGGKVHVTMRETYDVGRALRCALKPSGGALELRRSRELYAEAGIEPSETGIMLDLRNYASIIPRSHRRDFTAAEGPGLIGTQHRPDMFIEALRLRLACNPSFMTGLRGNVQIPNQTAKTMADWVTGGGLNETAGQTGVGVEPLLLVAKKISAYVKVGKDLLVNGSPDAVALVMNDLIDAIALRLETTYLYGSAKAGIDGVAGTTGVQTVPIADFAASTWKDWLKFGAVVGKYANLNPPSFILSSDDKQVVKGVPKDVGSGKFICEDDKIDGFAANVSGAIEDHTAFFGDWGRVLVGQWGGLEVTLDPYSGGNSHTGMVDVIATLVSDIVVRNPESFVKSVSA